MHELEDKVHPIYRYTAMGCFIGLPVCLFGFVYANRRLREAWEEENRPYTIKRRY